MNILIVSATEFEVTPLLDFLKIKYTSAGLYKAEEKNISILITGVGMVNTAFMMGKYANYSYDLVLNCGVCGAFNRSIQIGELVNIYEDILSEMGAEDGENFLSFDQLNLPGKHIFLEICKPYLMFDILKKVKGITVNTVHGNEVNIEKVKNLYHPDVESMEGAAFFAACTNNHTNFTQIRCVSNYVEKRDKSQWQMALAIKNLNDFLITFIKNI